MKIPRFLAASLVLAGAIPGTASTVLQTPRFAILNLPDSAYLQLELDAVPATHLPEVDSVRFSTTGKFDAEGGPVRRIGNLEVWWSFHAHKDSFPPARTVQVTRALAQGRGPMDSIFKSVHALRIDTLVVHTPGSAGPERLVGIPHVDNSQTSPQIFHTVMASCVFVEDSVRRRVALETFAKEWSRSAFRAILEPTWVMTLVATSPWTRTTGREDLPGIAAPLPGNRGNWLDLQTQMFLPRALGSDTLSATAARTSPTIVANLPYSLPTGFARYVYNRAADPWLKILETSGPRWIDSVIKVGPTLDVEGSTRDLGAGLPLVDSLMGKHSWLVLARTSAVESVDSAMRPLHVLCQGRSRVRAWKIKDSTVWLDEVTSIPLAHLLAQVQLGITGTGGKALRPSTLARVSQDDGSLSIELTRPASVRVVAPDGRIVAKETSLTGGHHTLAVSAPKGLLLVQVRQGATLETHRVVR